MKNANSLLTLFVRRWSRRAPALPRDFVISLPSRALAIIDPPERLAFLEREIRQAFGFRRVELLLRPGGPERFSAKSTQVRGLLGSLEGILKRRAFLSEAVAAELGVAAILRPLRCTYAFPLRQGADMSGALLIDSAPAARLDPQVEQLLISVCAQTALVLENSQLLQSKLRLQDELAQKAQMAQMGEMTARIAHEIKNPLGSIKTIVQVMQEDPALTQGYATDLQLIISEVDRLAASVVQLLNFARPSPQLRGSVSLQEVVASVLDFLRRDFDQLAAVADVRLPEELPPIIGNAAGYREVLINLLLNALQAGGKGTRIILQAWEGILEDGSEKFLLFIVEDDGPGIPPDLQKRVFDAFFTTRQRGYGLGLSIVRRHVEYFGGQIMVESPARGGRGTRFVMHLPVTTAGNTMGVPEGQPRAAAEERSESPGGFRRTSRPAWDEDSRACILWRMARP